MKNITAKVLKGIGIAIFVFGFFAALAIGSESTGDGTGIGVIVISFISGTTFIGFSEIISLLQENVNKQYEILAYMQDKDKEQKNTPKTVL